MCWTIYTDGACSGNPGQGGWAAILESPDGERHCFCGWDPNTTNNAMELTAVIKGLQGLPGGVKQVKVVTDSRYIVDGATKWIPNWVKNSWKSSKGTEVANVILWQELYRYLDSDMRFEIKWEWVKAHNGHEGNELADGLARRAINWKPSYLAP